jgi:nitrite reductase/ring-hydroxylating ferredoxin subunit
MSALGARVAAGIAAVAAEVPAGQLRRCVVNDTECVAARVGATVVLLPTRCPHRGGPLDQGQLVGAFLRCPWHGATFDVRTGAWVRGPACAGLDVTVLSAGTATTAEEGAAGPESAC